MLCCSSVPHRPIAVATEPGASVATARPMSPFASASATSVPAIAERSSAMPPSDSGTPRMGSPISRVALRRSSGAAQAVVGGGGRGPDHLLGELAHHVDQHLLVLGGREVEDAT